MTDLVWIIAMLTGNLAGDNPLLQLTVGGIFALLILREVFRFVKEFNGKRSSSSSSNSNGHSGDQSTSYWKNEIAAAVAAGLAQRVVPLLEEIKVSQKDDTNLMRERFHSLSQPLTSLVVGQEVLKAKVELIIAKESEHQS